MAIKPVDATTLLPGLWQALQEQPEHCALRWQHQQLTRRQLLQKSRQLAQKLATAGIASQQHVAVLLPRSPDVLVVLLALWWLGAAYVPLDPAWPRTRIESALALCQAPWLLTRAALLARAGASPCTPLLLEAIDYTTSSDAAPLPAPVSCAAGDPAYLLFTSGSSGAPKAVQIPHGALAALFAAVLPQLGLGSGWRLLGCSAFCFDIVFFEWLAPLLGNGSLVLADDSEYRDAQHLLQLIVRHSITVVQATPSLWRLLLQLPQGLPPLRHALATGEALDIGTARALSACSKVLWNLYGPTECTIWSSSMLVQASDLDNAAGTVSIGQPLPGYGFTLLPVAGTTPDSGELLITGTGVASGYLGAGPLQAQRFSVLADGTRAFRSGDLCRRDAHGNFHFLRRLDSQMKVNGQRIEAAEIEQRLCSHPGIRAAACLVRTLPGGDQLLAFVVCEPGMPNKDRERWNHYLATWLPGWMLPHRYCVLEELPLDANGKLDRARLQQLAQAGTLEDAGNDIPLQAAVARVFREVLALDRIGVCDSFFDLGGNSMLAATLLMAINQHFDTRLELRQLLLTPPTVQRVTRLLQEHAVHQPGG